MRSGVGILGPAPRASGRPGGVSLDRGDHDACGVLAERDRVAGDRIDGAPVAAEVRPGAAPDHLTRALADRTDRAPIAPRGAAIVAAAVVLGVVAHVAAAGHVRAGGVAVTVMLLVVAVSGILAAGGWVTRRLQPGRSCDVVEDATAALALVAGQVLVHWVGGTSSADGSGPEPGSGVAVTGSSALAPHSHTGLVDPALAGGFGAQHLAHHGGAMLAAHSLAALVVGLLLRGLEHSILRLGLVLRAVAADLARSVGALAAALAPPVLAPANPRAGRIDSRRGPPGLAVLAMSVVRRGPPVVAAS